MKRKCLTISRKTDQNKWKFTRVKNASAERIFELLKTLSGSLSDAEVDFEVVSVRRRSFLLQIKRFVSASEFEF